MVVEDFLHEILAPKSFALRDFLEVAREIRELLAVHHALVPNQAELRLTAPGRVRDHREGAGRCDRGDRGVADRQAGRWRTARLPGGMAAACRRSAGPLMISRLRVTW